MPKKFKCASVYFEVLETLEGYSSRAPYGETDKLKALVRINSEQDEQLKKSTLLHELLHCCIMQSGLSIEEEAEEKIVSALEPVLMDTLLRPENKALRSYLFGE